MLMIVTEGSHDICFDELHGFLVESHCVFIRTRPCLVYMTV